MIKAKVITMPNVNLYFVGSKGDVDNISDVILIRKANEPLLFTDLVQRVQNSRTLHCFVQTNSVKEWLNVARLNMAFKLCGRGMNMTQFTEAVSFERPDLAMKALKCTEEELKKKQETSCWAELAKE